MTIMNAELIDSLNELISHLPSANADELTQWYDDGDAWEEVTFEVYATNAAAIEEVTQAVSTKYPELSFTVTKLDEADEDGATYMVSFYDGAFYGEGEGEGDDE